MFFFKFLIRETGKNNVIKEFPKRYNLVEDPTVPLKTMTPSGSPNKIEPKNVVSI